MLKKIFRSELPPKTNMGGGGGGGGSIDVQKMKHTKVSIID